LAESKFGEIEIWQNQNLAESKFGGIEIWRNRNLAFASGDRSDLDMYGQQKNWMVSRVTRRVCEKNRPKVAQPNFWPDLMHNIYRRKICPNFFLLHPSFSKELPKVNNRPIGEHSPNLVTLNSRSFLGTGNSFQNGFPENLISLRKMVKKTPPISKGKKLRDAYCR
jgi:hypothetical protein